MQRIKYTTSLGVIEVDDVNVSSLTGEKILRLNDFDGNSGKTRLETMQCIGLPGQRVLSSVLDVKTVTAKISFAPVFLRNNRLRCTGSQGMYTLRREILKRFPLGEDGTLEYTNDVGTYMISARIDQTPVVTMHDGYFCECTIMFTCDYPYWCRSCVSEKYSVNQSEPALIIPNSYGDVSSPISGTITCTETLSGLSDGYVEHFILRDSKSSWRRLSFCKALTEGEMLSFSFGYNNEWNVMKSSDGGESWIESVNYVYFTDWTAPPVSDPLVSSQFILELREAGSLDIILSFKNLYLYV